jgi:hypothetical protein
MSSLLVEHGRHLLGDHALGEPDRVGLGQNLGSRFQSKTHFAEEIRGLGSAV